MPRGCQPRRRPPAGNNPRHRPPKSPLNVVGRVPRAKLPPVLDQLGAIKPQPRVDPLGISNAADGNDEETGYSHAHEPFQVRFFSGASGQGPTFYARLALSVKTDDGKTVSLKG